jgi:surface antigen
MLKFRTATIAVVALGLAACAAPTAGERQPGEVGAANKTTAGTILGAVGGGLLGSQIGSGKGTLIAVGAGTLLGAFLGKSVGESLDRADVNYANQAQTKAHAAPIGQQISWSNPETGNSGTVTPRREGTDTGGNYCREYQQTITVSGKTEQAYGTACRQPDGTWKVVN